MKLYTHPLSPNARRVTLAAHVLGISLDEHVVDLGKGEHKQPAYLALNPNGAIPTLIDGDRVLTESRAIVQYLTASKPESGLLAQGEAARAEVTRWQFWDASHFSPPLGTLVFERIIKPLRGMGAPDPGKLDEALASFRRFGAVLDAHLAGRRYVVGDTLTLADLTLAASLTYATETEVPLAELPHVQSWCSRIGELDAWKRTQPVLGRT